METKVCRYKVVQLDGRTWYVVDGWVHYATLEQLGKAHYGEELVEDKEVL